MNEFDQRVIEATGSPLFGLSLDVIQVNIGLKCDLTCVHCHVSSSPRRKEMMDWPTMELILKIAQETQCREVDITGGAPELNPHLRRFITALREQGRPVKLRTNLTVWFEPGLETMPEFFRDHQVHLVASLPCYLESNVTAQRGEGVYARSIEAIRRLNDLGYGIKSELPLDLVYNPVGPFLPGEQSALEADYRRELHKRFGLRFTRLLTITNMPIGRYMVELRRAGQAQAYQQLLYDSFNAATLHGLMCRHQINIDWDGRIYDCDFNLALRMPVDSHAPRHIRDFDPQALAARRIVTGAHCFGCTAGHGSSCGGALV
ncbi:MAG: arsenosugar biosynthesis radical SAM protein ArsS [Acidobacteriota bacterium]|nr:arsenosugar biosynthesis radical SAM protein ArsS [Blastocatellia bacterium]MDW8239819.1 arsenosugar biosynthesis radical SAM protein ArsS [Acidobacteriota bacterium]